MTRVAIVSGGTRGIGEAISRTLQDTGFTVVANYAGNVEKANEFTAATGIPALRWDVGDHEACEHNCVDIEARYGPIDVLVNNAGVMADVHGAVAEPQAIEKTAPAPAKKKAAPRSVAKPSVVVKSAKAKPTARRATPKRAPLSRLSARKVAPEKATIAPPVPTAIKPKETIVIDSSKATIEEFESDIQGKAKAVLQKAYAVASEVGTLTKGNAEACLKSGKILANGLKEIGSTYAAEGQAAVAALTSEIKELSAVKSPVDLFKLQSAIVRRNLEAVFAFGAKNGEALFALAKDSSAPIAKQANVVVETVRKVA